MAVGLDTRSHLVQRPQPNGEADRAAKKAAFQQQAVSFATRFRPGDVEIENGEVPASPRSSHLEMPRTLIFFSWWNEEVATPTELQRSGTGMGVRKMLRLEYTCHDGSFRLFLDDLKQPVAIAIEHADGSPVRARELFVGRKLDILGRPTTLRSAGAKTIEWIDAEAKRLLRRREWMVGELAKFCEVSVHTIRSEKCSPTPSLATSNPRALPSRRRRRSPRSFIRWASMRSISTEPTMGRSGRRRPRSEGR